ncbi:hypothetical protein [Streptomyces sp. NPDC048191]|uniref:hypothetical protein n=1 Tax=Streptomyces sp. NPDC048191 TaxID=3155484 RepID=UPI003404BCB0
MNDELRDRLYAELARILTPQESGVYLYEIGFPNHRLDFRQTGQAFWAAVRKILDDGSMVGGEDKLISHIAPVYPANEVLQEAWWAMTAATARGSGRPQPGAQFHPPGGFPPYGPSHMPPPTYPEYQAQAQHWQAAPGYYGAPAAHPGPAAPPPGPGVPPYAAPPWHAVRQHPQDTPQAPPAPQAPQAPREPRDPGPADPPPAEYHTLVFVAETHLNEFMQVVRRAQPSADVLFVNAGVRPVSQVAMLLPQPLTQEQFEHLQDTLRGMGAPGTMEIHQQVHRHRPHMFQRLHAQGPDKQPYEFDFVPSTTTGHDIAAAVLGYGGEELQHRVARRRRTVVDRVLPDGSFQRLPDLSRTLYDSGVRDGDTLYVFPESTAGASAPHERNRAILRVRREIRQYADRHRQTFRIATMDDPEFPTRYDISFDAPGFRPPPADAPPGSPPMPQNEHSVTIWLGPQFPYAAPVVVWRSPVFHPNILGPERPPEFPADAPDGLVCLGPLQRAYRPTMDFGRLCQMLVDIAGYQTYDVRPQDEGGEGWFNARAARWAASEEGEAMIRSIGGVPSAPPQENPDGDVSSLRVRALRLRKARVVGDDT